MSRSAIYRYPSDEEILANLPVWPTPVGILDTDTAQYWAVGVTDTGECRVWLTRAGRWVYTATKRTEAITADQAREMLAGAGYHDAVRDHIDKPRSGPGRPEIGPEVKVRLPESAVIQLDALAQANGTSRAEELRTLILDALAILSA